MSHTNRILFVFLMICLPLAAFSQKAKSSQQESKSEEASSSFTGLRKIAGGRNFNFDVNIDEIDQAKLEESIELAIENSLRSIEHSLQSLESLEIHLQPIEINLSHLDLSLDPIVINIPNIDIEIEPIEIELDELDLDFDEDIDMDIDMDFDLDLDDDSEDSDEWEDEDVIRFNSHDKADKYKEEKDKPAKDKSNDKTKGLKKIN